MTKTEIDLLQKCFLFSKDSDEEIESFLKTGFCSVSTFAKGDIVFGKETGQKALGILLSGKASALCTDCGKSSLKAFSVGELFGAASVFLPDGEDFFSHIRATSVCKVLFITKSGVENLLYSKPEKAISYIRFLSDRVGFLNRRISTFTALAALSRVKEYFLSAADENGVCKKVNFSALAKSLDISRASLYRAKSELVESKAITAVGRDILILDREALKNTN